MNRREATDLAARINRKTTSTARVVRILSEVVDPPHDDDNGWDVEVQTGTTSPISSVLPRRTE